MGTLKVLIKKLSHRFFSVRSASVNPIERVHRIGRNNNERSRPLKKKNCVLKSKNVYGRALNKRESTKIKYHWCTS